MSQGSSNNMSSNPLGANMARQPVSKVLINNTTFVHFIEWTVTKNSHFASDRFEVVLPIRGLPADLPLEWWNKTDKATVEIGADYIDMTSPPASMHHFDVQSLIVGDVDDVRVDVRNRTLTLTGRDYSSVFQDVKSFEKFPNKTASEVVQILAARHGLQADVTPTKTKMGTYYEIDHARMTTGQTEWDLLTWIAGEEDYDVWMDGKTVRFHPSVMVGVQKKYKIEWRDPSDTEPMAGTSLAPRFHRSLMLAKDLVVVVRSWNQSMGQMVTVQANSPAVHKSPLETPRGDTQTYVITRPNLTPAQAQQIANAELQKLTRHERVYEDEIPGDPYLDVRMLITPSGFGPWDGLYHIDQIEHRFNLSDGFKTTFRAKNHATRSVEGTWPMPFAS